MYTYICIHTYTHIHAYTHMYVCMYMYIYIYIDMFRGIRSSNTTCLMQFAFATVANDLTQQFVVILDTTKHT